MKKRALITGVSGQDGAYLAEFLIKKKYLVVGTILKLNERNIFRLKKLNIEKKIKLEILNIENKKNIRKILNKYHFNEIYNLAAKSSVQESFEKPLKTFKTTGLGVYKFLNELKKFKKIKFYQASSSEIFGSSNNYKKNENSKFNPLSPYAESKLYGHYITKIFRETFGMFAVSGIMFNHESPLRSEKFVTKKITKGLVNILNGSNNIIELGNINVKRDWGYSKEYVKFMWKMLQLNKPEDFIIATGKSYSIKNFIDECTKYLNLDVVWKGKGFHKVLINKKNNNAIIKINKKYYRKTDIKSIYGDITKAKKVLKWSPKINFKKLVKILIDYELQN